MAIASTASQQPILTRTALKPVIRARRYRPLFLLDLSVPRNIAPDVNELEGVFVFNIDDLSEVASRGMERRQAEAMEAENLVILEAERTYRGLGQLSAAPLISSMTQRAEAVRQMEMERTRGVLESLDSGQRAAVDAMTRSMFKRFLQILILMAWVNLVFIFRDMVDGSQNIFGDRLLVRAGIPLPTGLYIHKAIPAQMGAFAVFACLVLIRFEPNVRKRKIYAASLLVAAMQIMLSFSVKEIIAFTIAIIFYLSSIGARIDYRKAFLATIAFTVLSAGVLVTDNDVSRVVTERFSRYVGDESETRIRILLVNTSLKIANDRFPFGTGAGTFASAPSREMGYSPIYVQYRFYRYVGGRPDGEMNFLLDGFWPKVLAEGGWSGFIAYAMFLTILFRAILHARQEAPESGTLRFVELCWLFALPITLASGILTHERFVMVLAFTGFALGQRNVFSQNIPTRSK